MTRLPDLTWYVVEAKPGLGMMAEHNLRQQAYRLVSPWYVVERRSRRGGMVIDRRAWFPGYLFVGVRPGQAVAPINHTRGVAGIVPRFMPPMPLPWVAMRTLLEVVDLDGYVDDPGLDDATKDNPKPGELRPIKVGALADRMAEIASAVDKSGRVEVVIGLLRASIPAHHLGAPLEK